MVLKYHARVLALAAVLGSIACSDAPTAPGPVMPAAGAYELVSVNGAPLPYGDLPGGAISAETLFVSHDRMMSTAGVYAVRYQGASYLRTHPIAFQSHADTLIAPGLGSPYVILGNPLADPAILIIRGDTVFARNYYNTSGVMTFVRIANPLIPGPPVSLLLNVSDTLLFVGKSVDVQGVVRRGVDGAGLWIARPVPSVSVAAPAGWAANGTVLTAPASESEVTAQLSAGTASSPLTLRSVIDLSARHWTISWFCGSGTHRYAVQYPGVFADSISFSGSVDSVTYRHAAVYPAPGPSLDARLSMHLTVVQLLSTGGMESFQGTGPSPSVASILRQAPDSIIYYTDPAWGVRPTSQSVAIATKNSPRVYVGGNLCDLSEFASYRPAVLAEVP